MFLTNIFLKNMVLILFWNNLPAVLDLTLNLVNEKYKKSAEIFCAMWYLEDDCKIYGLCIYE